MFPEGRFGSRAYPSTTRSMAVFIRQSAARLRVMIDFSTIILEDNIAAILRKHILVINGYFTAAARCVDNELRYCVTGNIAGKTVHNFNSLVNIGSEMTYTPAEVALVQVIGANTHVNKAKEQSLHGVCIVVDAF